MIKKVIGFGLLFLSIVFFFALQYEASLKRAPISYYQVMAVRDEFKNQIDIAATAGTYRALMMPVPERTEDICIVDSNNFDANHFLCQLDRVCQEWKNKEANVFFLPTGDSFLLPELVPGKPAECFQIVNGHIFFVLKQKEGKIIVEP
ncbi:hypothetical protein HY639_06150 [Candidatus Woesearchaeota archaeon]|nr:hypothetical protein [Candidatus Woesearchaeota archaeon]